MRGEAACLRDMRGYGMTYSGLSLIKAAITEE